MSTSLRTDGVILRDGVPFFPIGMYHVSHYPIDFNRKLSDLGRMADAGFNCIATPLTPSTIRAYLDECARVGCYAIVEGNDTGGDAGLAKMAASVAGHPGLLGYQLYDDLGARVAGPTSAYRHPPEMVANLHAMIKAADPGALTYGSCAPARASLDYAGKLDVLAAQSYPIPNDSQSQTSTAVDTVSRSSALHKRVALANCQAFPGSKDVRPPTEAEVRMLTYRAIVAQAKGIVWYAMYSQQHVQSGTPAWVLTDSPLWPTMKALAREMQGIATQALAGTLR